MGKRRSSTRYQVADGLHSMAIHLLRRLRRVDNETGLSPSRLSALSVVVFGGPIRLGDLARAEQVRPPSMTTIVRQLEDDGLVTRKADPQDGRVIWLRATPAGRRCLQQGRSRRVDLLAQLLGELKNDELATLRKAVGLVEDTLRQR